MKNILLWLILIQIPLFTQWQEIDSPQSIQTLININSGSDFIIGSDFDPYFSFDGGETWEKRINGLPDNRGPIDKIIVENDLILISTSITSSILTQHILYSTDKGLNWKVMIDSLNLDYRNLISDFSVNNKNIYLLSSSSKLLKTSNFGNNWDTIQNWYTKYGFMQLFDVQNDTIVLVNKGAINSGGGTTNASYLISTNAGSSWEQRNTQLSTTGLKCLKIENESIYIGGDNGFYYSNDFGHSWKSPGTLVLGAKVNDFEIIEDTVYLATENGLFKAKDLFKGWEEVPFFKGKRVWKIHYGFEKLFVRFINQNYSAHNSYVSEENNYNSFSKLNFLNKSTLNSFAIDYPRIFFATEKILLKNNLNSEYKTLFESDTVFELTRLSVFENNIICSYKLTSISLKDNTFNYSIDNGKNWKKTEFNLDSSIISLSNPFILNKDTLLLIDFQNNIYISIKYDKELKRLKTGDDKIDNLFSKVYRIFRKENKIYYYGEGVILESDTKLTNWKSYSKYINQYGNLLDFSKSGNFIYFISLDGFNIMPSTVNFIVSKDEGNSWTEINDLFPNYENTIFNNVFTFQDYVFVSTSNGIFFSKNNGETFEEINDGLSISAKADGGEFHLYGDKILFCSKSGIFHRDLEELGITLTSVEKTENRNYLYTYPPFPQPTKSEVKINTYWDSALPFTIEDIEIYNLAGVKINTTDKLRIIKETNYNGHIIWDTSNEEAGIYIVNIKHGTEMRACKILVE